MGRTSDEEGETSAKTCRSDDSNDRPLKKARYVWQIKGKYHLKKPENEEGAKLFISDESRDGYALHPVEMTHCDAGTQNHEVGTTGSATDTNISKPEPTNSVSPTAMEQQLPRETENPNPWQLQKWQARQVARCFVDNTINRVLEDMGFIPLPVDTDDLMEDFTMSGLHGNDAHLEDAAVMMAIHSHGLQRAAAGVRGNNQDSKTDAIANSCVCNFSLDSVGLQNNFIDNSMDQIKGWYVTESQNSNSSAYENSTSERNGEFVTNGIIEEGLSLASGWNQVEVGPKYRCIKESYNIEKEEENQSNQDIYGDSNNEFDSERKGTEESKGTDGPVYSSEESQDKNSSLFEHTDFLDKAVAVAIQKKGLSTLSGIEYG